MELKEEHIGKKAVLVRLQSNLKVGSTVKIRGLDYDQYIVEIIDGKWMNNESGAHDCNNFFKDQIGYFVYPSRFELIEKEEETITYDLDNPFGGMENFK